MYCVRNVTSDLYWVGANDHRLALFENCFPIPRGVSYNAYCLLDEKTVLFDTVDWSACRQLLVNLDQMAQLMGYLNGDLADESDDLVDDTALYFFFVRLAARAEGTDCPENWQAALTEVTKDYVEPLPGARQKLVKVLEVMLTVWCANCLKTRAEAMIAEL